MFLHTLLLEIFTDSEVVMRLDRTVSKPFEPSAGVSHGCILSPAVLNIFEEYVIRKSLDG